MACLRNASGNLLGAVDVIMISQHSELPMRPMQVRQDRRCDLGRHSSTAEQLLIDEVSTEEDEIGTEGARFSDDALEAGDVAGMRAGVKIRKEDHSQRMGPSRPPIDCELQSANQVRARPRNPLQPTLAAELVSEGWSRDGADQTTSRTRPSFVPIHPVIPTPDGDRRPPAASRYLVPILFCRLLPAGCKAGKPYRLQKLQARIAKRIIKVARRYRRPGICACEQGQHPSDAVCSSDKYCRGRVGGGHEAG